jgi:predicted nucleic acid-binding protein
MILVDTSVWISYFRGVETRETILLDQLLETDQIVVNELIIAEILQGITDDAEYKQVKSMIMNLTFISMGGIENAVQSANFYRTLRKRGVTIRKTIDALIAAFCIRHDMILLHHDRDFEPFVSHFDLKTI